MISVYKYSIGLGGDTLMPAGAKVIHVHAQDDDVCLWAIVDTAAPDELRRFDIIGTGHQLPANRVGRWEHIGTAHVRGFVWHVFEVLS